MKNRSYKIRLTILFCHILTTILQTSQEIKRQRSPITLKNSCKNSYQHNTGREIRNHGTLADMLVKCQIESDKTLFNDLHGLKEQRFDDNQFFAESFEPKQVHSQSRLQMKIDKKQRWLVETLRKFVSLNHFYNKTMV